MSRSCSVTFSRTLICPIGIPKRSNYFSKRSMNSIYDHSEKLGDAFEYLLSVLGSQGDAGQFRTPRHVIDFMVKVVDPQKDDSILDPACGTAGFLISAYKHVLANNAKDGKPGAGLTPAERKKLANNIRGYDISPDMVRLSLVNLYLHGFVTPNIFEYDTLTSEERWNDYADVILANPPFMSPKGGIKPHKHFSVQSNRSEVLFVDYMAEHLTPNGRAAIIVPEGIIFQSAGAYKQLREYLIEHNFLWAVVSLPAGVFNPYAGVKTSILFLDKSLAKKTDKILFVKVEKDGYDLGAQRRALCSDMGDKPELCPKHSDLPDALNTLNNWHKAVLEGKPVAFTPTIASALLVSISKLAEAGDYNLSADRYREVIHIGRQTYPLVKIGDVCQTTSGGTPLRSKKEFYENGTIPWIKSGEVAQGFIYNAEEKITELGLKNSSAKIFPVNTVLVALYGATAGQVGLLKIEATTNQAICGVLPNDKFIPEYLYFVLKSQTDYLVSLSSGGAQPNISQAVIRNLQFPLPPLEIQRQIVDEIAAHQRIIDGARQVVEGWKPNIEIEAGWKSVNLGDIAEFKNGINFTKQSNGRQIKIIGVRHFQDHTIARLEDLDKVVAESNFDESCLLQEGDILFVRSNGNRELVGRSMMIPRVTDDITFSGFTIRCRLNKEAFPLFYAYLFKSEYYRNILKQVGIGANINNLSQGVLKEIEIPLPPLDKQREIVRRIEAERKMIEGNRELIRLYEAKVKNVIDRVWEG